MYKFRLKCKSWPKWKTTDLVRLRLCIRYSETYTIRLQMPKPICLKGSATAKINIDTLLIYSQTFYHRYTSKGLE